LRSNRNGVKFFSNHSTMALSGVTGSRWDLDKCR
jgi:hypothetical protein